MPPPPRFHRADHHRLSLASRIASGATWADAKPQRGAIVAHRGVDPLADGGDCHERSGAWASSWFGVRIFHTAQK